MNCNIVFAVVATLLAQNILLSGADDISGLNALVENEGMLEHNMDLLKNYGNICYNNFKSVLGYVQQYVTEAKSGSVNPQLTTVVAGELQGLNTVNQEFIVAIKAIEKSIEFALKNGKKAYQEVTEVALNTLIENEGMLEHNMGLLKNYGNICYNNFKSVLGYVQQYVNEAKSGSVNPQLTTVVAGELQGLNTVNQEFIVAIKDIEKVLSSLLKPGKKHIKK